MIFFAVAIVIGIATTDPAKEQQKKQDNIVYGMATYFVQQRLKTPSTAEFPPMSAVRIFKATDPNTWTVRGYVDSQNSFGTMIRANYEIVMKFDQSKDTWEVLNLKIE